jgi:hypothetical protein
MDRTVTVELPAIPDWVYTLHESWVAWLVLYLTGAAVAFAAVARKTFRDGLAQRVAKQQAATDAVAAGFAAAVLNPLLLVLYIAYRVWVSRAVSFLLHRVLFRGLDSDADRRPDKS